MRRNLRAALSIAAHRFKLYISRASTRIQAVKRLAWEMQIAGGRRPRENPGGQQPQEIPGGRMATVGTKKYIGCGLQNRRWAAGAPYDNDRSVTALGTRQLYLSKYCLEIRIIFPLVTCHIESIILDKIDRFHRELYCTREWRIPSR